MWCSFGADAPVGSVGFCWFRVFQTRLLAAKSRTHSPMAVRPSDPAPLARFGRASGWYSPRVPYPLPFGYPRRLGLRRPAKRPSMAVLASRAPPWCPRPPVPSTASAATMCHGGNTSRWLWVLRAIGGPMAVRDSGPVGRSRGPTEFRRNERQGCRERPARAGAFRAVRRNDRGPRAAQRSWAKSRTGRPYRHRASV